MPHGKTLELREFDRQMAVRVIEPRETRERDRSLAGKARRRMRRIAKHLSKQRVA